MGFTINEILAFIGSMLFMHSSLKALGKNLLDKNFEHFPQELSYEFLKLLKQKGVYPYKYMSSFKKSFDGKLTDI